MSIREGLMDIWCEGCPQHESLEICSPCKQKVERLIESLKSQGVVQKVDHYVSGTEVNCPNCHCAFLDNTEEL